VSKKQQGVLAGDVLMGWQEPPREGGNLVKEVVRRLDPLLGGKRRLLVLSKREVACLKRASDIAYQVRERCRKYGIEEPWEVDDLTDGIPINLEDSKEC
jgi:hypothetical protein